MLHPGAVRPGLLLVLAVALGACDGGPDAPPVKDPKSAMWETLAPVPQARFYVGVGAAREKVFVVGGFQDAEATLVHVYDTRSNVWSPGAPLPSAYKLGNVTGVGDRLFVLGGLTNPQSVEYDFATGAWLPRAPMPDMRGRGGSAIGVWGKTVMLAGGVLRGQSANALNTGVRMADVYAYDTEKDSWSTLEAMPLENGYAMGAVLGDLFWVIGGSTNFARTEDVLVFDLVKKVWMSALERLPVSISSAAVGIVGGHVILTGGIASSVGTISRDTLVLDPSTGKWSTIAPLPTARFATGGAVVGNKLYVPTGIAADATTGAMFVPVDKMEALGL